MKYNYIILAKILFFKFLNKTNNKLSSSHIYFINVGRFNILTNQFGKMDK